MTAPDRIQITHRPRTMITPDFRALCAELLPVEPPNIPTTMAMQYRSAWREGVEDGWSEARAILARWAPPSAAAPAPGENLATPPSPEAPGEALAARPLLEKVARLDSSVGITVAEVRQLAGQAAAWLRSNPPGQQVAIEPRGCPTPGACSCVEPTPPAPEPGDVAELVGWLKAHANDCHELGRNDWAEQLTRTATLLQQQEAELAALRVAPGPTFQDAIRLAQGCHDYSGGHTGPEGKAWHGAIDTVAAVLQRAAVGPWDSQTRAVYGVGSEAQSGEVAVPEPVAELDDQRRGAVHQAVAEALGGAYDCLRVWEAWGVGTMGPDDFVPVAEDSDRVAEIADAAIEAIRAIPLPAPQAGEVEA